MLIPILVGIGLLLLTKKSPGVKPPVRSPPTPVPPQSIASTFAKVFTPDNSVPQIAGASASPETVLPVNVIDEPADIYARMPYTAADFGLPIQSPPPPRIVEAPLTDVGGAAITPAPAAPIEFAPSITKVLTPVVSAPIAPIVSAPIQSPPPMVTAVVGAISYSIGPGRIYAF